MSHELVQNRLIRPKIQHHDSLNATVKHLGSSLAVAQHTAENLEKDFISKGSEATGLAEANAALNSEIDSLNATVEHLESSLAAAQHTADLLVVEREMLEFGFNRLIREKATLAVEVE